MCGWMVCEYNIVVAVKCMMWQCGMNIMNMMAYSEMV